MTQLEATLRVLMECYPEAISHREGMDKVGFAFRSRCSDLRQDYGIGIALEYHRPSKQGFYRLTIEPEEALALYREGRKRPVEGGEGLEQGKPRQTAPDAKGTVPFKPTGEISAYLSQLGRKSGEKRREGSKYVKVGNRYVLREKFEREKKEAQQVSLGIGG